MFRTDDNKFYYFILPVISNSTFLRVNMLIYIAKFNFFVLCEEVSVKGTTTLHGYKVTIYSINDANIQSATLLTPNQSYQHNTILI
jgi:hypothetical protein